MNTIGPFLIFGSFLAYASNGISVLNGMATYFIRFHNITLWPDPIQTKLPMTHRSKQNKPKKIWERDREHDLRISISASHCWSFRAPSTLPPLKSYTSFISLQPRNLQSFSKYKLKMDEPNRIRLLCSTD